MPSTLDLCEKYYGTRDIYDLMGITKDALEKDVKKAYYRLSLQVHPDRVPDEEKNVATEKFKVLSTINSILTDKDKKALYDERGIIDDNDDDGNLSTWLDLWRTFFKPITTEDIDNFQRDYVGSDLEKTDLKEAYLNGKGCINVMMSSIPFMGVEDEPRFQEIVKEWIAAGEVPEYKMFTEEPKAKRTRRHNKYRKEALQARQIKEEMDAKSASNSLEQQIMARQKSRGTSLIDSLMAKYGGDNKEDDSELFDDEAEVKKHASKKTGTEKPSKKKENVKEPVHRIKNGRVMKTRSST
ncbi:J domain-containing protein CG6693-like [Bradysia coprophila]|uniref:J domain-containing protein CG6693-like n=1 Tax=Bradysia coprophila TaxID=38358 RepID=UPI00187D7DEF|nr:J domain-containing protein CG6693-like [Bradysia coprophila]